MVCGSSVTPSQAIEKLVALLDTLDRWIDETPPVDQPSRFGNKAYRTWYAKLDQVSLNGGASGELPWSQMGQGLCSEQACLASKHKSRICQNGSFIYLNHKITLPQPVSWEQQVSCVSRSLSHFISSRLEITQAPSLEGKLTVLDLLSEYYATMKRI